jgi:hypothetical protein
MPAVNPTQLKIQLDALMFFFNAPPDFHRELSVLFSLYANRALRFGDTVPAKPLIRMYHLPFPIIRQLRLDLQQEITKDPENALACADELWQDPYLEVKETAIFILGHTILDPPEPILNRLHQWLNEDIEKELRRSILSTGTYTLQTHFPQNWEDFIKSFLLKSDSKNIALGLQGLAEGINNPEFNNFPIVFRLVSNTIQEPQPEYRGTLITLIESLAKRLPIETAYFLRQAISISNSPQLSRLIKGCLPFFPDDIQKDLSASVRK